MCITKSIVSSKNNMSIRRIYPCLNVLIKRSCPFFLWSITRPQQKIFIFSSFSLFFLSLASIVTIKNQEWYGHRAAEQKGWRKEHGLKKKTISSSPTSNFTVKEAGEPFLIKLVYLFIFKTSNFFVNKMSSYASKRQK